MLRKTQRRAWKALRGGGPFAARSGGRIQPGGDRGSAQWRLGESRVCLRSGLRTALGQAGGEGGGGDGGDEGGGQLGRWGGLERTAAGREAEARWG